MSKNNAKSFRIAPDIVDKVTKLNTKKPIKGIYFMVNFFMREIEIYKKSLFEKIDMDNILKLKDLGDYSEYFNEGDPTVNPKIFLRLEWEKHAYKKNETINITLTLKNGNINSPYKFIDDLSYYECLALIYILSENTINKKDL